MPRPITPILPWLLVALLGLGCDGTLRGDGNDGDDDDDVDAGAGVDGGAIDAGPGADGGGSDGGGVDGGPFTLGDGGVVLCGDRPCQCSNGLDDDDPPDGLIDGADPECAGPQDDDESSFGTGISGDNRDPFCQDCFFDGNSGSGDDGCRYATSCTTEGNASSGSGSCATCDVTDACVDFCAAYAPNGCDCFGCCTVTVDGTDYNILLGTDCSLSDIESCETCTKDDECQNPCGPCELCGGKTLADLPEDCGGVIECEGGTVCSTTADCDTAIEYCSQGCCILSPLG